jgi:4-hydroxybutyrate dehydrogenase/sulfolactaldehyde 3-reductase
MSGTVFGFIGLGAMGLPIARRLIDGGYVLQVFDLSEEKAALAAQAGATPCSSAREASQGAEAVFTIVPDGPDAEAAILGPGGVAEGIGRGGLLVEMSTIDPQMTNRIGAALESRGIRVVDAPVYRSTAHAERGELMFGLGGSAADMDEAARLLAPAGNTFVRCGPFGSAVTLKLVNNMLAQAIGAAVSEAVVLAEKAGLPFETVQEVLRQTAASNRMMEGAYTAKAFCGDFSLGFAMDWAGKDVGNALAMAARLRSPCPVAAVARQLIAAGQAKGRGRMDHSALLTVIEDMAGVEVRRPEEGKG